MEKSLPENTEQLNEFRLRPRFKISSELCPEEIYQKIALKLKELNCQVVGQVLPGHCILMIPSNNRKIWSPIATVSIEENTTSKGSLVNGLYGPAPGIWTLVMFLYITLGFSIFLLLFWGLSLYSLGKPAPMLWFIPPMVFLILLIWGLAKLGQRLSRAQIEIIHHFLETTLDQSTEAQSPTSFKESQQQGEQP